MSQFDVLGLACLLLGVAASGCSLSSEVKEFKDQLTWHESSHRFGSACISFKHGGKQFYVDPAQLVDRDLPKADYILLTHSHDDHLDVEMLELLAKEDTLVMGPPSCGPQGELRDRWPEGLAFRSLQVGDQIEEPLWNGRIFPAFNPGGASVPHPQGSQWIGYRLVLDNGVSIYISGDTSFVPQLEEVGQVDFAVLAYNDTCMMGKEDVLACVNAMMPKYALLVHWLDYERNIVSRLEEQFPREVKLMLLDS